MLDDVVDRFSVRNQVEIRQLSDSRQPVRT